MFSSCQSFEIFGMSRIFFDPHKRKLKKDAVDFSEVRSAVAMKIDAAEKKTERWTFWWRDFVEVKV